MAEGDGTRRIEGRIAEVELDGERGAIAALQPDGVILTPPHSQNPMITRLLDEQGISFARIGSMRDGPGFALIMGDEHAARLATDHLLGLGHRRIGFIAGPPEFELSGWRVDGWRAAMTEAGCPAADLLRQGDFSYASGLRETEALLDFGEPPTAIIASNDQMAVAALAALRSRGLDVPSDVSLISFEDTPIMKFTHPPLTAVVQPVAETISRAVELIIAEQAGHAPSEALVIVPSQLVLRRSTAPPPEAGSRPV